jgi:methyltransferase (TIGR00027 family)
VSQQHDAVPVADRTAVRVALWRAQHVQLDASPHVLEDEVGLRLAAPDEGWQNRPDMSPATRGFRASIVGRARYVEDLVEKRAGEGVGQYVILGAGLDTFAQRRPDVASRARIFEVDQPGTQAWKRQRLGELGLGIPAWLRLVPVDFEAGDDWWQRVVAAGLDPAKAAVVAATGVSMYLTKEAILATLRRVASLARGSTLVMTYLLPMHLVAPEDRAGLAMAEKGARASGTPFISFFAPEDIVALAREAGFAEARTISRDEIVEMYFAGRSDGLRPSSGEDILVAET